MANTSLPSFADLKRNYAAELTATTRPDERDHLIKYLRQHGAPVVSADDVYEAVVTLSVEEELAAFRCKEGVAVSHASDGWWLLLRSGEPIEPVSHRALGDGTC